MRSQTCWLVWVAAACAPPAETSRPSAPPVVAVEPAPTESAPPNEPPAPTAAAELWSASPFAQRVLAFCEEHRRALEARDVEALLALASPDYHDTSDTPDEHDDVRFEDLASHLEDTLRDVESVRYAFEIRRIRSEGSRVVVDLTYAASYRHAGKWLRTTDDTRLVLEPHGASLRALSGL